MNKSFNPEKRFDLVPRRLGPSSCCEFGEFEVLVATVLYIGTSSMMISSPVFLSLQEGTIGLIHVLMISKFQPSMRIVDSGMQVTFFDFIATSHRNRQECHRSPAGRPIMFEEASPSNFFLFSSSFFYVHYRFGLLQAFLSN
jgi:hypothetical protein